MYELRDYVESGGLMAYGPSVADLSRRAATYMDKILKGARPADLRVEQPTKFELVMLAPILSGHPDAITFTAYEELRSGA